MATKKITDLQLRSSVIAGLSIPSDDGTQSYRVTATQIKDFVLAAGNVVTAAIADLGVTTGKIADLAVTAAKIAAATIDKTKLDGSTTSMANEICNVSITASCAANALTIALKTKAGANASATDPATIGFRNATSATGDYVTRSITAALSLVISSGSTLGHASGADHYIYVYAIDNGGTVVLGASTSWFDNGSVQSSTAEGGAGAADSNRVLYTTAAVTNKAVRLLARIKVNQATAGTWVTAPSEISLWPFERITVAAKYYSVAGTAYPNGPTTYTFPTKVHDTHNIMASSVATINEAGKYMIKANTYIAGTVTTLQYILVYVRVNGTTLHLLFGDTGNGANVYRPLNGELHLDLAVGDTVDIRIYTNTAGTQTENTNAYDNAFEIVRMGK
jgi:hypothetical protein